MAWQKIGEEEREYQIEKGQEYKNKQRYAGGTGV